MIFLLFNRLSRLVIVGARGSRQEPFAAWGSSPVASVEADACAHSLMLTVMGVCCLTYNNSPYVFIQCLNRSVLTIVLNGRWEWCGLRPAVIPVFEFLPSVLSR